jgi:3-oxoacyl-[acyl-carrier protein] reductase
LRRQPKSNWIEEMSGPSLSGKSALVTGSSRGIGRAIAQRLASAGAEVIVTGRRLGARDSNGVAQADSVLETLDLIKAEGGNATGFSADLELAEDRERLLAYAFARPSGIDILVNNAGVTTSQSADILESRLFEQTVNYYFRIPFLLSKAVIPHFRSKGAGWIVNVGSVASLRPIVGRNQVDGDVIYASCKAALARMTKGLALELMKDNIAVNLVAPSTAIRTPGSVDLIPADFPTEDPAYLAETALQLVHLPAAQRTGAIAFSLHFPLQEGFEVFSLNGQGKLPPPVLPSWVHPDIESLAQLGAM